MRIILLTTINHSAGPQITSGLQGGNCKAWYLEQSKKTSFVCQSTYSSSTRPDSFYTYDHNSIVAQHLNVDALAFPSVLIGQRLSTNDPLITDTISSWSMSAGKATVTFASDQNVAELQPGKDFHNVEIKALLPT